MAGRLTRGEVRLVRFPPPDKERPVLILTRQSSLPALRRPQAIVGRHVATLSPTRMRLVCRALAFALGCSD